MDHEGIVNELDLFDVFRACFRRWYAVLPLLAISVALAYHAYANVRQVYYLSSVIGIAPPNSQIQYTQPGVPVPRNGLLDAGGPSLLSNMLALTLNDASVRAQVVAGGGRGDYTAKMFPVPASVVQIPLVMIEATAPDAPSAAKTIELVAAQADPLLQRLQQQAGVPSEQVARALMVSPPGQPTAGTPARTRAALAILIAGVGLTIVSGVVVDAVTRRVRARGRSTPTAEIATESEPLPDSDAPTTAAVRRPTVAPAHNR